MNRVVLVGRLAADPEMSYTQSGLALTKLRIAVRDPFRKDEQGRQMSDFFDVNCWRQQAEYAGQYLEKGTLIALHGRLSINEWIGEDGQKRRKYYVTADQIENWGKQERAEGVSSRPAAPASPPAATAEPDEAGEYNDPFADQ